MIRDNQVRIQLVSALLIVCPAIGQAQERISADGFCRKAIELPENVAEHWNAFDKHANRVAFKRLFGRPTVVVLFRGHGCYHCVQQLSEIEKMESRFRSRGVRLIAISDEDVDTMKGALQSRPLPFTVLSDSESRLSKYLGSDATENWHGVVILDEIGKAKWLISGDKPLMDFREVISQLDELEISARALKSLDFETTSMTPENSETLPGRSRDTTHNE